MTSPMTDLLERNERFIASGAHKDLSPLPSHTLVVLTCMDQRVDPAYVLGVELGDALVVRNVGGRVTTAVEHDLAFLGTVLTTTFGDDAPPFEVAVIHHTGCGSAFLSDETFTAILSDVTGTPADALTARAVIDPVESVRADLERLRTSPVVPDIVTARGYVYDISTGVVTPAAP